MALRNYGGGRLPVVRQARLTISRSKYTLQAVVQVQRDAPARLLIGTDLLSKLGFHFTSADPDKASVDLLESPDQLTPSSRPKVAEAGQQASGTVALLQAARLPGRHGKLVRARVPEGHGHPVSFFEPSGELGRNMALPEAVVEPGPDSCVMVVLENHGPDPLQLEEGEVLGWLERAEACPVSGGGMEPVEGIVSAVGGSVGCQAFPSLIVWTPLRGVH